MSHIAEFDSCRRVLSRRSFCQVGGGLLAGGVLTTNRSTDAADAPRSTGGPYVDVHVHIGGIKQGADRPLSVDDLLRWMDQHRVAQACVLPLVSPEAFPNPVSTEYVLEQSKPHPDRLIPFCAIDPRNTWYASKKPLVGQLERYKELGAKGFGEHKPGLEIIDRRNMAIFEACEQVGLPVLFHLDTQRNIDLPGLPGLARVLKTFPECIFIGHATGFWSSISGGPLVDLGRYQEGKVQSGGALDRLMDAFPNLYGDLSAHSGWNAINRDREFGRQFVLRRADRLLFGTDFLTPDQQVGQFDLYQSLDLPEDVQQKIFLDNARRLLKLG